MLAIVASAGFAVGIHGCREPTQVTLDIRTLGIDCKKELGRITIAVARDALAAEAIMGSAFVTAEVTNIDCAASDRVGTLVVTPESETGAVIVAASYSGQRCLPPDYKECVVSRRRFSFVEHTRLTLPITLEASCRDVPCGTFSSCRSGTCVDSFADCQISNTCPAAAEPVLDGDGGVVPPPADAGVDSGAVVDAGTDTSDAGATTSSGANGCPAAASASGTASVPPSDGGPPPPPPPGPDCAPPNVCCVKTGVFNCLSTNACAMQGNMGSFSCTGRKYCPVDAYCCGPTSGATTSSCRATSCGVDETLCTIDADCPPPLRCAASYGPPAFNGSLRRCVP